MQVAPVQVTVVEYVAEFFRKYKTRAYGKTIASNAKGGADAFMGMLKLVLAKGGRDELRIALHCFKDQLKAALHSAPSVRSQHVQEVFALLSSLIDAAERLRQFSPVKETISCAVLEEVRWRLFRVLVGDGFSDHPDIRRRALDIVFVAYMREQSQQQQQQQRHKQLAAAGAGAGAGTAASQQHRPGSPSKAARLLQRKGSGVLSGPDVSSWEGLWCSLAVMSGRRMMPLLQSVMAELYQARNTVAAPAAPPAVTKRPTQSADKQQKQQQQLSCSSSQASAGNSCSAATKTVLTAGGATIAVAPVSVVAAGSDDALCGVSTPPLRTSDGDAGCRSQPNSADTAACAGTADVAAHTGTVAADLPGGGEQHEQHAIAAIQSRSHAVLSSPQAAGIGSPAASEAAAAGLDNVVYVPGAAVSSDQSGPTWLTCASFNSSTCCPTDSSIDGTDASVVSTVATLGTYQGVDYAEAMQESMLATSATAEADDDADVAAAASGSSSTSACVSPTSSGKKGFAAKFKEFKESVKESVANVKESVASSGSHSHSITASSGSRFGIPRSWVQFNHRQGHERDQDEPEQCSSTAVKPATGAAAVEGAANVRAIHCKSSTASEVSPHFDGEDAVDWSTCSGSVAAAATSSATAAVGT